MSKTETEMPRVFLMFTGVTEGDKDRMLDVFEEVEKVGNEWTRIDKQRLYSKLRTTTPGGIISVCYDPKTPSNIYPNSQKWEGQWHDDDDRAKWTAVWRAKVNAHRDAKAAKEAMKADAAVERLEPFKRAYHKLNAEGRRQMLAELLRYITT